MGPLSIVLLQMTTKQPLLSILEKLIAEPTREPQRAEGVPNPLDYEAGGSVDQGNAAGYSIESGAEDYVPQFENSNTQYRDEPGTGQNPDGTWQEFDNAQPEEHVDPQQLREQRYFTFEYEAEEDYTAGPVRLVAAHDGVQDCIALLMKLGLSAKIQRAVQTRRSCVREQEYVETHDEEAERFRSSIDEEIDNYNVRVAEADEKQREDPSPENEEELRSLQTKLDVLKHMMANVESKQRQAERGLENKQRLFHNALEDILPELEEAFTWGQLVPFQDEEASRAVEHFDFQQAYEAAWKEMQGLQDDDTGDTHQQMPEPLETGDDFLKPQLPALTPEQQAQREIGQQLWDSRDRFTAAQRRFDHRDMEREYDRANIAGPHLEANQAAYATTDEFDLVWAKRYQEITQELREAEDAFNAAKETAVRAGVLQYGMTSSLADEPDYDAYPLSAENDDPAIAAAQSSSRILDWRAKLRPEGGPDKMKFPVDFERWDDEDIEPNDSVSCVAFEPYRGYIDGYGRQLACLRQGGS
ncbi:hypothetical protein CLAFUW4_02247 [Fulvia fulva]|uniref:Uncharacterized protein n=1 Tax=Passalora fulva TaxID=5499 RepID=A0A9Q8P2S1_PASFU|nr:uncharacterized protein CLAFUR5_02237 [Fulvia fulva]KAK4634241.1 hypothetical protein CLAFUR4_02242 [Fulvia fulva]KAK4636653.1 hypothetical protein CLAFUR0_02245 [Fulvia fulva]UJO11203.1 hypothetical protein CLAFUR5_02237 [Fulvia fulva]WPV08256.1 hypothetical protein CLAFUW4_02247 [Fulvia fulva]WPV24357.1 hypothetical protein CLAFUW7_02247 [Fulvia fulva]